MKKLYLKALINRNPKMIFSNLTKLKESSFSNKNIMHNKMIKANNKLIWNNKNCFNKKLFNLIIRKKFKYFLRIMDRSPTTTFKVKTKLNICNKIYTIKILIKMIQTDKILKVSKTLYKCSIILTITLFIKKA